MNATSDSFGENTLLGTMPKSDLALLSSQLELKELTMGEVLQEPNKPLEYAYDFYAPTAAINRKV